MNRVVERFLSETIDGEEQRALGRIPVSERKHPNQIREGRRSLHLQKMEQCLGVTRGVERESGFESLSQFPVVVDLTVERDPRRSISVRHRLVAVGEIDDAQSPESQSQGAFDMDPLFIRTPVMDPSGHGHDDVPIHRFVRAKIPDAADAAHSRSARNAGTSLPMSATHSIR